MTNPPEAASSLCRLLVDVRGPVPPAMLLTCTVRSLTEIKADVKETREAISAVANDDGALAELCLTERHGSDMPWCGPCSRKHTVGD